MINGNPEFSDIVYDFLKSRVPSISKDIRGDGAVEMYVTYRYIGQVYGNEFLCANGVVLKATDPNLFARLLWCI
jgi:hypothetical protein